jgi:hypothetical protein
MNTGNAVPKEAETASALLLINSADFGPGIAVTRLRFCAIVGFDSEYMQEFYLNFLTWGTVKIGGCGK